EGVGATAAALVDLSTVAGNKISNPPWVKFQSAGWVNFPSAPTAKALIDECLHEWTEGARAEVITLINDAFRVDQAGNIRTGSVLALRRLQIDDERWQRAMQAIGEAVQVVSTKAYVRIQERVGDTDQYRSIPLDIAGV
ncbi:DUF3164 family protein, partial [Pseudomonas aeruginosa]|uniref:DUF3164 family protein n=1 Tax=Pseudomonas aeruginosa TaxID=287 RepID=UPI0031B74CAD